MASPGDEMAAGGASRGRMRASHADRERVIDTLKTAFAQGRLAKDEFAHRGDRGLRGRMDVRIPRALARESRGRSAPAVALLVYLATFIYPAQDITELKGAGQGPDGCRIGCLA
jgi:hypothetical protein